MAKKQEPVAVAEVEIEEPRWVIESDAEADDALAELGMVGRDLEALKNDRAEEIAAVTGKYADEELPARLRRDAIQLALEAWWRGARGGRKSIKLRHGEVGFRVKPPVVQLPPDEDKLIEDLEKRGLTECVAVRKSPLKEALKRLNGKVLTALGVKVTVDEVFYVKAITPDTRQGGS